MNGSEIKKNQIGKLKVFAQNLSYYSEVRILCFSLLKFEGLLNLWLLIC